MRTDFSRGEQVTGLVWLGLAALTSLLLEVVYLGARLPLGETGLPFPITILIAAWFNSVLTRTARLWSSHPAVALVPLMVWIAGFAGLALAGGISGVQALGASAGSLLLFFGGVCGGVWPLFAPK